MSQESSEKEEYISPFRERVLVEDKFVKVVRAPIPLIVLGVVLAAFLMVCVVCTEVGFNKYTIELLRIWNAPTFMVLCAAVVGIGFSLRIRTHAIVETIFSLACFIGAPFAAYYFVEIFNGTDGYARDSAYIMMNVAVYAVVYLFCLFLTGRLRWAIFLGTLVCFVFAAGTHFVELFRGTPLVPLDLLSSGTGLNVAENYDFELHAYWVAATIIAALMMTVGMQCQTPFIKNRKMGAAFRLLALALSFGLVTTQYSSSHIEEKGYSINYWEPINSYDKYGQGMAFALGIKDVYPEKPEGYKASNTEKIMKETLEATGVDPDGDKAINMLTLKADYEATNKQPNIIMIMNESFADLQSLADFETNQEVMPFFKSLTENTIRGNLEVPTFGGGTATTEYEVLTGNGQRFLPLGSVAYSSVIHDNTPSFVWNLRQQGYTTQAFHPYNQDGWSRDKAYTYLGFEDFISLEDILSPATMQMEPAVRMMTVEEEVDPEDGDVYNRDYMSDHYDFKIIQQQFEARDKSKPYFMFNVTIQNHGGYASSADNFYQEIYTSNMDGYYSSVDRYLSLMHASDQAFEELITYFESVDEPTIVVMFGDHLPSVEEAFYKEVMGKDKSEYDDMDYFRLYRTPFVIWANYDIPEKDLGTISANYLSTLVAQVAGNELTEYERYLASLYKDYSCIGGIGIVERGGTCFRQIEGTDAEEDILNYQRVAYNNLLDYSDRKWELFSIDGEPEEDD